MSNVLEYGTDFVIWNLYQNCQLRLRGFAGVAGRIILKMVDILKIFLSIHDGFEQK